MLLKHSKSPIIKCLLLLVLVGLIAGCGAKDPAQIKGQSLVVGVGRDFYHGTDSSSFVHGSTGVRESLTYLNENLEPVPQLAEKIVPDDTNKVWTAYLRQGVKFHDGTPLNAEAVVKSVQRLKDRVKLDEYGTFIHLEKVEATSDRKVKFTFSKPNPAFPAKVTYHGCPIFSFY